MVRFAFIPRTVVMGEYEPKIEVQFPDNLHVSKGSSVRLECFALGKWVSDISKWRIVGTKSECPLSPFSALCLQSRGEELMEVHSLAKLKSTTPLELWKYHIFVQRMLVCMSVWPKTAEDETLPQDSFCLMVRTANLLFPVLEEMADAFYPSEVFTLSSVVQVPHCGKKPYNTRIICI